MPKLFKNLDKLNMMMTGFEKSAKLFGLFFMLYATPSLPALADSDMQGRQFYEENCASCHGFDGVPILPASPNFSKGERMEKADAERGKIISDGKGQMMPPWGTVLNKKDQADVLAYIRSMAVVLVGGDIAPGDLVRWSGT